MAVPVSNAQPILDALISLADAFNGHDLDRIMNHFADDAVLEMPRGKDPWGTRFVGKAAVREGLAGRFKGVPDVHYGNESHFVAGDTGILKWTVSGTSPVGKKIRANGCDIYTFRAGLLFRQLSIYQHIHMMPVVRQKRLAPASFCFSPMNATRRGNLRGTRYSSKYGQRP